MTNGVIFHFNYLMKKLEPSEEPANPAQFPAQQLYLNSPYSPKAPAASHLNSVSRTFPTRSENLTGLSDSHFSEKMRQKRWVPQVLWRLFRHRARTLSSAIAAMLPPPPSAAECRYCKGSRCLRCSAEAMSFLVRPDDPSDYFRLLNRCFVVMSDDAPPLLDFDPRSRWSQAQVRTPPYMYTHTNVCMQVYNFAHTRITFIHT